MSIEAQYYCLPIAVLVVVALSGYFAFRLVRSKAQSVVVGVVLWLVWFFITGGLLLLSGLIMPFLFFANHPMDPPFK